MRHMLVNMSTSDMVKVTANEKVNRRRKHHAERTTVHLGHGKWQQRDVQLVKRLRQRQSNGTKICKQCFPRWNYLPVLRERAWERIISNLRFADALSEAEEIGFATKKCFDV